MRALLTILLFGALASCSRAPATSPEQSLSPAQARARADADRDYERFMGMAAGSYRPGAAGSGPIAADYPGPWLQRLPRTGARMLAGCARGAYRNAADGRSVLLYCSPDGSRATTRAYVVYLHSGQRLGPFRVDTQLPFPTLGH